MRRAGVKLWQLNGQLKEINAAEKAKWSAISRYRNTLLQLAHF
jgi:hypothetical protein